MDTVMDDAPSSVFEYVTSSSDEDSSPELEPMYDEEALDIDDLDPIGIDVASNASIAPPAEQEATIHARAYQLEMFEASLKENIIVVMDTGSGKTQVAVLRIKAELEKPSHKLIWFLAPTVTLCEQQHKVLTSQIGAVQIKLLSGNDDVDTWTNQQIWDDYLWNVRVVVSTHQVLLDAVSHGFVKISGLSLLVFDEAHHCNRKHPGSKLMERYRISKSAGLPYPSILGLTASPLMKSQIDSIEEIERTLDATCRTPSVHRTELLAAVNLPKVSYISLPELLIPSATDAMESLGGVLHSLDITMDPSILHFGKEASEKSLIKLARAFATGDTLIQNQMKSLVRTSTIILLQLGRWAADYYIYCSLQKARGSKDYDIPMAGRWSPEESQYLADALQLVKVKKPMPFTHVPDCLVSSKFEILVQRLLETPENAICIVFIQERCTVAILNHMLSAHPSIKARFRVGRMIGTSNSSKRKYDLGDFDTTKDTLDLENFRAGKLNLLLATSILEEGIDVPACNFVFCFDQPTNLKSFIQRRGRARMPESELIVMVTGTLDKQTILIDLEKEMKMRYEDEMRAVTEMTEMENMEEGNILAPLIVAGTGARLDFDQAKSHLEHFCNTVAFNKYVDHRPFYMTKTEKLSGPGLPNIKATVILPSSLPQSIRRVNGVRLWHSEKNAFKDAALQAIKAINELGLLNLNLLPISDEPYKEKSEKGEQRARLETVDSVRDPWPTIARLWRESAEVIQRRVQLKDDNAVICEFDVSLPVTFPCIPEFPFYWDKYTTLTVATSSQATAVPVTTLMKDQSPALLALAFGYRFKDMEDSQQVMHIQSAYDIDFANAFLKRIQDNVDPIEKEKLHSRSVVRFDGIIPHIFHEWFDSMPDLQLVQRKLQPEFKEPSLAVLPWVAVKKWPRRFTFLSPQPDEDLSLTATKKKYYKVVPVSHCMIETVERAKIYFGMTIPSYLHMVDLYLAAEELCDTVLPEVAFADRSLVVSAISSAATSTTVNYERLEFLGDTILKTLATIAVMVQYPIYPEGYLSHEKGRIVTNSTLYRVAIKCGLDKFIRTEKYNATSWRPMYIKNYDSTPEIVSKKRTVSTKTLADVVEALIGAAHQDGGMPEALTCLRTLMPNVPWKSFEEGREALFNRKTMSTMVPTDLEHLEELIGYTFQNKTLMIEAITHASSNLGGVNQECMERLEFLGDAILDIIIVDLIWGSEQEFSNSEMHLLKQAVANEFILGFLVMQWCDKEVVTAIDPNDNSTHISQIDRPVWKFMRSNSMAVTTAKLAAEDRYHAEREQIEDLLKDDKEYPWAELMHLDLPKFFCDMFESLVGAVWVDSGSIDAAKGMAERLGLLPLLRRLIEDKVELRHPKNKLGELAGKGKHKLRYQGDVRYKNGVKDWYCQVFVDEEMIVEVDQGMNQREIEARATEYAWRILKNKSVVKRKRADSMQVDGEDEQTARRVVAKDNVEAEAIRRQQAEQDLVDQVIKDLGMEN
ncbi:RNase3 domain-containing protein [Xylariaceae sp. FL1019]|nr:RNase3 domain-containing protein [Xylariaceae sp. FL1019]